MKATGEGCTGARRRSWAALAVSVVALAACGDGGGGAATAPSATDATASTIERSTTTTPAPTTSERLATTATPLPTDSPETTTTVEAPCEGRPLPVPARRPTADDVDGPWLLRDDGFGPFDFGTPSELVVPALEERFGPYEFGDVDEFPRRRDDGMCLNDIRIYAFAQPVSVTWCVSSEVLLCVTFGGPSPSRSVLVGWTLGGRDEPVDMATAGGIRLGSRLSDHLDVIRITETCRDWAAGTIVGTGITLDLGTADIVGWGTPANPPPSPPDPATVTVGWMTAGDTVLNNYPDDDPCA